MIAVIVGSISQVQNWLDFYVESDLERSDIRFTYDIDGAIFRISVLSIIPVLQLQYFILIERITQ